VIVVYRDLSLIGILVLLIPVLLCSVAFPFVSLT
jgi:hypothetical protein